MSLTLDSTPRRPVRAPVVSAVNGNHLPKALDAQPVERGIAALPATAEKPGKLVNPPKRHEPVYLAGPLSGQGIYLLRPLQLLGRAPKMSLSSDIAQGNAGRLAGRKGSANPLARLFPARPGLIPGQHDQCMKPRRQMRHHLPALERNNPLPSHPQ
jgi:hypothetical protein